MINELSVHPKSQNKSAHIVCGAFMASFIAALVIYLSIDRFKGIIGLCAIVLLTVGIMIYTRYISAKYYYDITYDVNSCAVLVVRQLTGKRQSTLCCIALSSIVSVVRETKDERRAHKTPMGTRKYNYTPTLMPDLTYRITSNTRLEKCELVLEISDEYAKMLIDNVEEAKAIAALNEDD